MKGLTDVQVESEIWRLNQSEYVALARKQQNNENRSRQYLYTLRQLEKKGRKLSQAGITMEMLNDDNFDDEKE